MEINTKYHRCGLTVASAIPAYTSEIPGSFAILPPVPRSFSLGQRLGVTYIPKGNDDTATMMHVRGNEMHTERTLW
jgi:hypothetical protein